MRKETPLQSVAQRRPNRLRRAVECPRSHNSSALQIEFSPSSVHGETPRSIPVRTSNVGGNRLDCRLAYLKAAIDQRQINVGATVPFAFRWTPRPVPERILLRVVIIM